MNHVTTTENIVRQMTKKQEKALDPERKPVWVTTLKKGQRVQVFDDPTKKDAIPHGIAVLRKLNDAQVYHDKKGFENWRVEFEGTGEEADRIIAVRHLVANPP